MKNRIISTAFVAVLAFYAGFSYGDASHNEMAIDFLKKAIAEAIQCGGGGADGSGCKGPRGEAIKLMKDALSKLQGS